MATEPLLVDPWPEGAETLGLTKHQVYSAIRGGHIPVVPIGARRVKIARATLERLRQEGVLTTDPAAAPRRQRKTRG